MSKQNKSKLIESPIILPDLDFRIEDELTISDPELIACLIHDKKQQILKSLIKSEFTIRELSRETKINPGTVKRHINDLEKVGLVKFVRQEKNEYGILLKFYRFISRKFKIHFELA